MIIMSSITYMGLANDTTPNAFSFTDFTYTPSIGVRSPAIQVSGINKPITATANGSATLYINNISSGSSNTVSYGDLVQVAVTTPTNGSTTNTLVTLGGVTDTWSITGQTGIDVIPTTPNLGLDKTAQATFSYVQSNSVTVAGLGTNAGTIVQIYGQYAECSINSGPWVPAGYIQYAKNSDVIDVRVLTDAAGSSRWAKLILGNTTDEFIVSCSDSTDATLNAMTFNDIFVNEATASPPAPAVITGATNTNLVSGITKLITCIVQVSNWFVTGTGTRVFNVIRQDGYKTSAFMTGNTTNLMTFQVSNLENLAFGIDITGIGSAGGSLSCDITVLNNSDSNATVDSFNVSMTSASGL